MQEVSEIQGLGAMQKWSLSVKDLLLDWGLADGLSTWVHLLGGIIIIGIVAFIVDLITKRVIVAVD